MTIHREGRVLLVALLVVLLALIGGVQYFITPSSLVLKLLILGCALFYFLFLQFFRLPIFEVKRDEALVMAPADGKVVVIEDIVETEYFGSVRKQISIFMSPLNVHVNLMPVGGVIRYYKYHPGKYLVAWHPKSSTDNERTTIVTKMKSGTEVLFRQIAGALARRIKCYVHEGQTLEQGEEFGFIKFGSRVDVFLPLDADVTVKPGDVVKGGKTILARFR